LLGEHTRELLSEVGVNGPELESLANAGVIGMYKEGSVASAHDD
jgi:hypothetical protein